MKKYLITGLITALPVILTIMVIVFLFDFFTAPFVNLVDPLVSLIKIKLHISLPKGFTLFISRFFSLIFLCIFIFFLGFVTQLFLVKTLISWGDKLMERIPFIRGIYRISRDIFATLFATDGKKAFKKPVMIPFPGRPNYCLGFVAGEVAEECQQRTSVPLVSVFAPTAPHPVSGFLFLVPESDVHDVDMTNEEVVKFLVSCGMILPEDEKTAEEDEYF